METRRTEKTGYQGEPIMETKIDRLTVRHPADHTESIIKRLNSPDKQYRKHRANRLQPKTSASQDAARYWWTAYGTKQAQKHLDALLVNATPEQVRHAQQQLSDQSRDALTTCSATAAPDYARDWGKAQRILQLLEERDNG